MSNGTTTAWQARDMQRNKLLERIHEQIMADSEMFPIEWDLYRVLLRMFDRTLFESSVGASTQELSSIPQDVYSAALQIFLQTSHEIEVFSRSESERRDLFGSLLEWTAQRLAAPGHSALRDEASRNSKLIYGTGRATDEVPIPD